MPVPTVAPGSRKRAAPAEPTTPGSDSKRLRQSAQNSQTGGTDSASDVEALHQTDRTTFPRRDDQPSEQHTLSQYEGCNNDHIRGTVGLHFDDCMTETVTGYAEAVLARITFKSEDSLEEEDVGCIDLTVIDKDEKGWYQHLVENQAEENHLKAVSAALWGLLRDKKGSLKELDQEIAKAFATDVLVYISTIETPGWEGKGIGRIAMSLLHRMLPEYFESKDPFTMLLQPAALENRETSKGKNKVEVQRRLVQFYSRLGYTVWHQEATWTKGYKWMLMGQKIEPAEKK